MPAPTVTTSDAPARQRHGRRWIVLAVVGAVLLVALAVVTILFLTREDPGARDVSDALEEFRAGTGTTPADAGGLPPAGVYEAAAQGQAALSFPPLDQDDGATVPVTVEHLDDECWRLTVDYNEAHWQTWHYCVTEDGLIERGGETSQRWDLGATSIDNVSEFTCDPPSVIAVPDPEPGDRWEHSCVGTNTGISGETISAGPYRFVGTEQLDIGNRTVTVHRYHQERTLSGAQRGTTENDLWIATEPGLPVRAERTVRVESDSPVGAITYTESGEWQLTSLDPTA